MTLCIANRTIAEVKEARKTAVERQKVEEKLREQKQQKVIAKLRDQLQALRHKVCSLEQYIWDAEDCTNALAVVVELGTYPKRHGS